MQPVPREGVAGRVRLRDLVLVMGEDEVQAAAVDVELGTEVLLGHRRALEVPAGPAGTPRGVPGRLALLGALPEREVQRVLLGVASSGLRRAHVLGPLPGEGAVRRERRHVEVDVAAGGVGVAAVDQALHQRTISGTWPVARGSTFGGRQPSDVVGPGERALVALGDDPARQVLVAGVVDDLVVDVGDVADEGDGVPAGLAATGAARRSSRPTGCGRCAAAPARWPRTGRRPRGPRAAARSRGPGAQACRTAGCSRRTA